MGRVIRDCSVCVVGGAGFLGSHLVNHLLEDRDCQVLVIDNLVAGRREWLPRSDRVAFEHADITGSEDHLRKLFTQHQVEYVWNAAARPYVPDSYSRPLRTFDVNAMGALKVMSAAQDAGVKAIGQISSAEIYGHASNSGRKIAEDGIVEPHSTYGSAKMGIDSLVQVRWREAGTPCIAIRQFNACGERDCLHPYVAVEIYKQLKSQNGTKRKVFLGNNSWRDFIYAKDAVALWVDILEHCNFGEVVNVGSEEGIHVYNLAHVIGSAMGVDEVDVVEDQARKRAWEIWSLAADCTKLYALLGRKPKFTSLVVGMRRTVEWLEANGGLSCFI